MSLRLGLGRVRMGIVAWWGGDCKGAVRGATNCRTPLSSCAAPLMPSLAFPVSFDAAVNIHPGVRWHFLAAKRFEMALDADITRLTKLAVWVDTAGVWDGETVG